jgi:hypothetical protein
VAEQGEQQQRTPYYRQLWFYVVIAIVAGVIFGLVAQDAALKAQWLAEAFIQLIKAVTGPVIFVTVVIAGLRLDTSAAGDPSGDKGPRWRPVLRSTRGFKARHPEGL